MNVFVFRFLAETHMKQSFRSEEVIFLISCYSFASHSAFTYLNWSLFSTFAFLPLFWLAISLSFHSSLILFPPCLLHLTSFQFNSLHFTLLHFAFRPCVPSPPLLSHPSPSLLFLPSPFLFLSSPFPSLPFPSPFPSLPFPSLPFPFLFSLSLSFLSLPFLSFDSLPFVSRPSPSLSFLPVPFYPSAYLLVCLNHHLFHWIQESGRWNFPKEHFGSTSSWSNDLLFGKSR